MSLRRRRSHYQQLTEFKRCHVKGLRENGFLYRHIAERLDRNISTVHDCWEQLSRDGTPSRIPGLNRHITLLRGKTAVFGVRLWRIVLRLRQKFELQLVPQRHNELLELSYFKETAPIQAPCSESFTDPKSLVFAASMVSGQNEDMLCFSNESRFCLGTSSSRVLVRRRPGKRLQLNCLWPRDTGPTPGTMVWVEISYI
ncbi:uncharacterized protein TNCV_955541 [Trichonephila clavipes]|nr:uncharacterized protein TNCV_955541 [Trichonephila clavipes]